MPCCIRRASSVSKIVADDVATELARLETAIAAMRASVDELIDRRRRRAAASIATCSRRSA